MVFPGITLYNKLSFKVLHTRLYGWDWKSMTNSKPIISYHFEYIDVNIVDMDFQFPCLQVKLLLKKITNKEGIRTFI
jgi:hypothetical protein